MVLCLGATAAGKTEVQQRAAHAAETSPRRPDADTTESMAGLRCNLGGGAKRPKPVDVGPDVQFQFKATAQAGSRVVSSTMELQGTGDVPSDELRADIAGTGQFSDEVRACVCVCVCVCGCEWVCGCVGGFGVWVGVHQS
jgi:hypothetical protein